MYFPCSYLSDFLVLEIVLAEVALEVLAEVALGALLAVAPPVVALLGKPPMRNLPQEEALLQVEAKAVLVALGEEQRGQLVLVRTALLFKRITE